MPPSESLHLPSILIFTAGRVIIMTLSNREDQLIGMTVIPQRAMMIITAVMMDLFLKEKSVVNFLTIDANFMILLVIDKRITYQL